MKINIEDMTTAINEIIANKDKDFEQIVPIIKEKLPQYDVENLLFLFLQALTAFWSNPLVGKWNPENGLVPYSEAVKMLIETKLTAEGIAEYIVKNVADILLEAKLEPIYVLRNGKVIYISTNPTVDELYQARQEINKYKSAIQERYNEWLTSTLKPLAEKYNAPNISEFAEDVKKVSEEVNIEDFLGLERRLQELQLQYQKLLDEVE